MAWYLLHILYSILITIYEILVLPPSIEFVHNEVVNIQNKVVKELKGFLSLLWLSEAALLQGKILHETKQNHMNEQCSYLTVK